MRQRVIPRTELSRRAQPTKYAWSPVVPEQGPLSWAFTCAQASS
jgi:hypothetical protein